MASKKQTGKRLRQLREARTLNLTECAKLAGCDAGNLSRLEAGEAALSASYAWRLARVLGDEVLELTEARRVLQGMDVSVAQRRRDLDPSGGRLRAFALPGGVRVLLPVELARGVGSRATA